MKYDKELLVKKNRYDGWLSIDFDENAIEESICESLSIDEDEIDWDKVKDYFDDIIEQVSVYFKQWFKMKPHWERLEVIIDNPDDFEGHSEYKIKKLIDNFFYDDIFNNVAERNYKDVEQVILEGKLEYNIDIDDSTDDDIDSIYFWSVVKSTTIGLVIEGKGIWKICEKTSHKRFKEDKSNTFDGWLGIDFNEWLFKENIMDSLEIDEEDIDWDKFNDYIDEVVKMVSQYFKPWFNGPSSWDDDELTIETHKYLRESDIKDLLNNFDYRDSYTDEGYENVEQAQLIGDLGDNQEIITDDPSENDVDYEYFSALIDATTIYVNIEGKNAWKVCGIDD